MLVFHYICAYFTECDTEINDINPNGSFHILPKIQGEYKFSLTFKYLVGAYDITSLQNGDVNYIMEYFYITKELNSTEIILNYKENKNNNNDAETSIYTATLSQSELSSSIAVGAEKILNFTITEGMGINECDNITELCVYLTSANNASYKELNDVNSISCFNLTGVKNCEPRE